MRVLFDGIPLDQMSVSMTMNGAVLPVLALYIVAAEEQGVPPEKLAGHHPERHPQRVHGAQHVHLSARALDADRRRHLRVHVAAHAEVQLDLDLRLPHAGGRRDGGPRARPTRSPTALEYVRAGIAAGLDIDAFAPRLSFFLAIGMNFFMEVAKLRAARLLWAKLVSAASSRRATSRSSLRTHCQTSGWSLTAQDVFNNVVRTCIEAMAATQGHTQSLHTNALDEALALPTDFSARIARNTQLFLQQESGTCRVDRSVGRQLLRRAAHARARRARAGRTSQEVEALGGMAKAIEAGVPKLRIEEAAARTQARIDSGRQPVVGVNTLPADDDERRSTCSRSTTRRCGAAQIERLERLRRRARRRVRPTRALDALTARGATRRRQPARARRRRGARARHGRRDQRRAREGVRPPPGGDPRDLAACTAARWASADGSGDGARARVDALRRARRAGGRASSSRRWARTATTAGRR